MKRSNFQSKKSYFKAQNERKNAFENHENGRLKAQKQQ